MLVSTRDEVESKVSRIMRRYDKLKADKQPWILSFELISEYVRSRKRGFNYEFSQGQFLSGKIYDSTASIACYKMASSLIGALFPNSAKTFEIKPAYGLRDANTSRVRTYFENITKIVGRTMDNPKAGFSTSLQEHMNDQGAFGTSGMYVIDTGDKKCPVAYRAIDVKRACIAEGHDGFVDTVYTEMQITVRQMVQEYGIENVSEQVREAFDKHQYDEKRKVLHAIEPRSDRNAAAGNRGMPIVSIYIELETKHILKESGFQTMPIMMSRFWKESGEVYGRSPAFESISDILEANAVREAAMLAIEKALDPPLALYNDGSLGGGVVDTSAGALTVLNISGRLTQGNQKVIEQLVTTGELTSTYKHLLELHDIIEQNFFIDRLLDLNNDTRMTLGEANIRNELRGQSLGAVYGRQIIELLNPVIERTFSILLQHGYLGVIEGSHEYNEMMYYGVEPLVIPESVARAMLEGKEVYDVTYNSPASRIMRQEELTGITRTVEFGLNVAAAYPPVLDNFDFDQIMHDVQELTGAPARTLHAFDKVIELREAREQQQAQMAQVQAGVEQAKATKDMALAAQAASKAGIDPNMMLGGAA